MFKKYKLTEEFIIKDNEKLFRIESLCNFSNIKKGDVGGYVASKYSISHYGDSWAYDDSIVSNNAELYGNAKIYNNVILKDRCRVHGNSKLYDNVIVEDCCEIYGNTKLKGNKLINNNISIFNNKNLNNK